MKRKIILYSIFFFVGSLLFSFLVKSLEKRVLRSIYFTNSEIKNFRVVIKTSSSKYIFGGRRAIEKSDVIYINRFYGSIYRDSSNIELSSDFAELINKKSSLVLKKRVKINLRDIHLRTDELTIDMANNIARNEKATEILTKTSKTKGYNVFIDLKNEKLSMENVLTVIKN